MHKQTSKQEDREVGKKLTNGPGVSPMFILREGLFNHDRETPTVKYIQQWLEEVINNKISSALFTCQNILNLLGVW